MKFINLTPHEITIYNSRRECVLSVPPSGLVARVNTTRRKVAEFDGVEIYQTEFGAVENLPPPEPDTIFIVSGFVAAAVKERHDVLQPGELLRNENGQPIGCVGLQKGA